jgi:hypothetical protein
MKISHLMTAAVATMALAAPVMADDSGTTSSTPTPQQQCRTEQTQMGSATFKQTYGTNKTKSNAFGKCVSKRTTATDDAQQQAQTNAAKSCKAEQAADPAAFKTKYGTGKTGNNAYGRCVAQAAKAKQNKTVSDETSADVSAAKSCKAERATDPAAFKAKYGTNKTKSNAFGKCVSQQAKAQNDSQSDSQTS